MEIRTKFAIGDKLWKIENSKAVCFEVRHIAYDGTAYYGSCPYDVTIETQCFASKEALLKFVAE